MVQNSRPSRADSISMGKVTETHTRTPYYLKTIEATRPGDTYTGKHSCDDPTTCHVPIEWEDHCEAYVWFEQEDYDSLVRYYLLLADVITSSQFGYIKNDDLESVKMEALFLILKDFNYTRRPVPSMQARIHTTLPKRMLDKFRNSNVMFNRRSQEVIAAYERAEMALSQEGKHTPSMDECVAYLENTPGAWPKWLRKVSAQKIQDAKDRRRQENMLSIDERRDNPDVPEIVITAKGIGEGDPLDMIIDQEESAEKLGNVRELVSHLETASTQGIIMALLDNDIERWAEDHYMSTKDARRTASKKLKMLKEMVAQSNMSFSEIKSGASIIQPLQAMNDTEKLAGDWTQPSMFA